MNLKLKEIKLILAFGLFSWGMLSQDNQLPNFTPRTPEATAFLKYGEYPTDLSTGVPNISIPIYTVDVGGFKMPITLDYHASGIKVNQEATMVGLGWNLNTGAQIILSSRDEIDENSSQLDDLNLTDFKNYFNDNPYDFTSPLLSIYQKSKVKDVYMFSSPTGGGNFYINNFNSNDVIVFPPDSFKVELLGADRTNFGFKITDKSGNIYMFNNTKEKSYRSLTHHDYYISAWYVDKIQTPNNEIMYFTYQDDGEIVEDSFLDYREFIHKRNYFPCVPQENESYIVNPIQTNIEKTLTNSKKLKEINYNSGLSKIEFVLKAGRQDLINQNSFLESIKIQNKADGVEPATFKLLNQVFFEYTYFNPLYSELNSYKIQRLKLERIFDLDSNNIHSFKYSDINLPAKDSKSQDLFGYFNNASNSDMIPLHFYNNTFVGRANRNVNSTSIQAGMLKEIQFPTKGRSKFNYESNIFFGVDYLNRYTLKSQIGTAIGLGSASNEAIPWEEGEPCPNTTCIVYKSINFNAINANGVLNYQIRNLGNTGSSTIKYKFCKIKVYYNGELKYSDHKNVDTAIAIPISFNGPCTIKLEAYGEDMHITADFSYLENDTTFKNVVGPGLRIQNIENYTDNNTLAFKKIYEYNDRNVTTKTSGMLVNQNVISYISNPFTDFKNDLCPPVDDGGNALIPAVHISKVYRVTSQSKNKSESNSIDYKFVKETTINTSNPNDFSSIEYEYTTSDDWILPNFDTFLNLNWKRGKIIEKKYNKSSGGFSFIVKKERNTYKEDTDKTAYYKGFEIELISRWDDPGGSASYHRMVLLGYVPRNVQETFLLHEFNYPIPWYYQNTSETTDYFYNSSNVLTGTIVNQTNYFYDNPNHLQLTRQETTNSNNETLITKYSYPDDLLSLPLMSTLKTQNRVGEIIKTETFKNGSLLSTQNKIYKDWGNNLIAPEIIQTSKGSGELENKIRYNLLDNTNGSPLEFQQEGGSKFVYIWGYNQTLPIAKIENATYASITPSLITAAQKASDTGTEASLLTALTAIRKALPNAMVTTYTHKPLIGVSTITDPKGDKLTYEYDEMNRLKQVKDKDGNILSENEYNYKN